MASEWRETTIGEFASFAYGKGLPEHSRKSTGDVPVFGSNGLIGFHDKALTDGPTIIIGRKGTVGAVHYSPVPCWPIDTTFWICDSNVSLLRFKYYLLKSMGLEHMNADSAVPGLNRDSAHARRIRIPHVLEQCAIAHILGTLDDKIELNRRMNATLELIAQAIFKSWLVDFDAVIDNALRAGNPIPNALAEKAARRRDMLSRAKADGRDSCFPKNIANLFPDRFVASELGPIPEGWQVYNLGELIELAYGKALKEGNRKPGRVPVFGSNGQVGWHDEALAKGPGIIVGRKGNPGTVAWAPSDFFAIDTTFYVVLKSKCMSLPFLFYALSGHDLQSLAADSAVPGLNRNFVYFNFQLVPPPTVLEVFDRITETFFDRQFQNDEESRVLANLRDLLLPRLISGELEIKDTEKILEKNHVRNREK